MHIHISGILGNLLAHFLWRLSTESVGYVFLFFFFVGFIPGSHDVGSLYKSAQIGNPVAALKNIL